MQKPGPLNLASQNWKFEIISDDSYPKQQDAYNCGVYVMSYMNEIAKNYMSNSENRSPGNIHFHPDLCRSEILDFFNQKSLKNICLTCGGTNKQIKTKNRINQEKCSFQKCSRCEFWNHKSCYPENFFIQDVCLICYNFRSSRNSVESQNYQNNYYLIGFPRPVGTNTCWLNSSLHILFTLPVFADLQNFFPTSKLDSIINRFAELQKSWRRGLSKTEIHCNMR